MTQTDLEQARARDDRAMRWLVRLSIATAVIAVGVSFGVGPDDWLRRIRADDAGVAAPADFHNAGLN